MSKTYTVEKEIKGKKYTAQFNGLSAALEAVDNTYLDGSSNTSMVKMTDYLFENVIVEPKGLTVDDFEDMEEMSEVVNFARRVMQGELKSKSDDGKKSKE